MAEGLAANASPKSAHILRKTEADSTGRQRIPINLQKILNGKSPDVELTAADILFIPDNVSKRATTRTLETILQTVSGIAIYGVFCGRQAVRKLVRIANPSRASGPRSCRRAPTAKQTEYKGHERRT